MFYVLQIIFMMYHDMLVHVLQGHIIANKRVKLIINRFIHSVFVGKSNLRKKKKIKLFEYLKQAVCKEL